MRSSASPFEEQLGTSAEGLSFSSAEPAHESNRKRSRRRREMQSDVEAVEHAACILQKRPESQNLQNVHSVNSPYSVNSANCPDSGGGGRGAANPDSETAGNPGLHPSSVNSTSVFSSVNSVFCKFW